jgi:DNA mismatch repair ATPase MutS
VINYLLTAGVLGQLHAQYKRAFAREAIFAHYPALFRVLAEADFDAPLLRRLRAALVAGDGGRGAAHVELARLVRLMEFSEVRRSALTYLPVQAFTLWDFHLIAALERWQRRAGRHAREWIDAAAEIEALAALATLAHDQPDWAWPAFTAAGDTPQLTARDLGHPLLRDSARVGNDVEVGPPGSFLLVTGSNMSGKSTLLRSLGLNAVLAQAGAPVCAASLRMPPLEVRTSIRIEDSIASGVSLFMAELLQMKRIVEAARALERDPERTLLFLLDEILHGTNTAERRIAAKRIILHLLAHGAIGAVTTHDLTLAEDPALGAAAVPVHFTERVNPADADAPMSFDYRLRHGLATSTNALRLMELVGLGDG